MVSLPVAIQLLLIALLLCAIKLQLSMRKQTKFLDLGRLGADPAMLKDFLVHSAEREIQNEADVYQSPLHFNQSSQTMSLTAPARFDVPNVTHLGCIDVVRRCMKFKYEKRPHITKGPTAYNQTVALAAPVLKGGYRNQYMRFVAFVAQALAFNQKMLLESVKWHEKGTHAGIPFEMLWDVDKWNQHPHLPKFVPFDKFHHTLWNAKTTVFKGSCATVIQWFQSPHRTSILSEVQHMNSPFAAGGARSGQPGNLWDYYRSRDKYGMQIDILATGKAVSLPQLEEWILTAMEPSDMVQQLVDTVKPSGPYIALHPRIEPEMLEHSHCQANKIRSLSQIMKMVTSYPAFEKYPEIFVAVAMPQMILKQKMIPSYRHYKVNTENVDLLQKMFAEGYAKPSGEHLHVWTAGESVLQERDVNVCMLQLMASIVNMELAVQANVFVGTSVSTWSTSVWKIRHYRGKPNYIFTPTGIQRLEGLPPAFKC